MYEVEIIIEDLLDKYGDLPDGLAGDIEQLLVNQRAELTEKFNKRQEEYLKLKDKYDDLRNQMSWIDSPERMGR